MGVYRDLVDRQKALRSEERARGLAIKNGEQPKPRTRRKAKRAKGGKQTS